MKAKKIYINLDIGTDDEKRKLYEQLSVFYPGKIYEINLPEVVEIDKSFITKAVVDDINLVFKAGLVLEKSNLLHFPYRVKEGLIKMAKISKKESTELKMSLFNSFLEKTPLKGESKTALAWLVFKSDYKDSGDYSIEEMDSFIKNAVRFKGGFSL